MRKYPINSEKKGYIAIEEAEKIVNAAFYDGFITAMLETPEEAEELTPAQRLQCAELAILKNAILTRSTPPQVPEELKEDLPLLYAVEK